MGPSPPDAMPDSNSTKQPRSSTAGREARELIFANRGRLAVGLALMIVSRGAGLVLPWSTKPFVDDIMLKGKVDMLPGLVFAVGGATVIQEIGRAHV